MQLIQQTKLITRIFFLEKSEILYFLPKRSKIPEEILKYKRWIEIRFPPSNKTLNTRVKTQILKIPKIEQKYSDQFLKDQRIKKNIYK